VGFFQKNIACAVFFFFLLSPAVAVFPYLHILTADHAERSTRYEDRCGEIAAVAERHSAQNVWTREEKLTCDT
jgi:hypothetical protein